MNYFDRIRHRLCRRRRPRISEYTLFLKLVDRRQVGRFVFAHYLTNPDERPDHTFRHDCRFRSNTQGDFETARWTVEKITPAEDAMLERTPGGPPQEHLVVLTDADGNVLLQDYCSTERATLLMTTAAPSASGDELQIG